MKNPYTEIQQVGLMDLAVLLNRIPLRQRADLAPIVERYLKFYKLGLEEHAYLLGGRPLAKTMELTGSRLSRDFQVDHFFYVSEDGHDTGRFPALKGSMVMLAEVSGLTRKTLDIYRYQAHYRMHDGARAVWLRGTRTPICLHWYPGAQASIDRWQLETQTEMQLLTDWWKTAEANPKRVAPPGSKVRRAY